MADTTTAASSSSDQDEFLTLHLTVTGLQGSPRIPIQVPKGATSTELRQEVSRATSIPSASLRLIFRGRMIADHDDQVAATEFKLEDGSVLHCMGKPEAAPAAAPALAATSSSPALVTGGSLARATIAPAASDAAASASTASPAAAATRASSGLWLALQELRRQNGDAKYGTAVSTLDKILSNIVDHPMEEKYRNLKVNNPAFQRRFGALNGADAVMTACGFVRQMKARGSAQPDNNNGAEEEPYYVLQASAESWPKLLEAQEAVESAYIRSSASSNAPVPPVPPRAPSLGGRGMGFGGGGGAMPLAESQAVQSLMADPAQLQSLFQNPMVQSMMRNDPRLNSNPMLRQVMDELSNNPMAAQELATMMSDPTVRSMMMDQAARMQPGGGGMGGAAPRGGGAGGATGFPPGGRPAGGAPAAQQPPGGASVEDLTEEEMIAEAIRRSLQDGAP